MRNPIPRVAAIHDLAGFARTSLTAAIPILSSMGIQATPLPTAILSTQTVGYNDFTLLDLTDDMVRILDHWERLGLRFDGVYSGFMASTAQMDSAARCIRNCLAPGGLAVVDPVLGDDGKLIPTMTPEMVAKMRWLITCADLITPNFTEVCLLLDEPYSPEADLPTLRAGCAASPKTAPRRLWRRACRLRTGRPRVSPNALPSSPTNGMRTVSGAWTVPIFRHITPERAMCSPVC